MHFQCQRVLSQGTAEAYAALQKEIEHRQFTDKLFNTAFDEAVNAPETPQNFDCLRVMVEGVEDLCGTFSAYSLKYVYKLANLCDTQPEEVTNTHVKVGDYCNAW